MGCGATLLAGRPSARRVSAGEREFGGDPPPEELEEGPEEGGEKDSEGESKGENEEESGEYYESEDPAYLEALAATLAASKRSGLWDFGQQGFSSSGAGPLVVAAEGTSVSVRALVSPTTPTRVFWLGTLHLSIPSAEGKGYLIF